MRDSEERHGQGQEFRATIERFHLFAFVIGDMDGVLVVAGARFPMMLGRNGEGAEDGRGYRQEESKREEETVRTVRPRKSSLVGSMKASRALARAQEEPPQSPLGSRSRPQLRNVRTLRGLRLIDSDSSIGRARRERIERPQHERR